MVIDGTLSLEKQARVTYKNGNAAPRKYTDSGAKPAVAFGGTTLAESATLALYEPGVGTAYVGLGKITGVLTGGTLAANSATWQVVDKRGGYGGVPKVIINPLQADIAAAAWPKAAGGFFGSAGALSASFWGVTALTGRQAAADAEAARAAADNFALPAASAVWYWVQNEPSFNETGGTGWVFRDGRPGE